MDTVATENVGVLAHTAWNGYLGSHPIGFFEQGFLCFKVAVLTISPTMASNISVVGFAFSEPRLAAAVSDPVADHKAEVNSSALLGNMLPLLNLTGVGLIISVEMKTFH